jgi:hypothetical protein
MIAIYLFINNIIRLDSELLNCFTYFIWLRINQISKINVLSENYDYKFEFEGKLILNEKKRK